MINKEIFEHKHICLVGDHYNPLGIIRSLGEAGINPIVLLCAKHPTIVQHSKYIGELHRFDTIEEGYHYMVDHFSNEPFKPFVYNGSDDITLLLDNHYEELKDHFYFTNGRGSMKKYLQKYDITQLAVQCGVNIPKEELLNVGEIPSTLKFPVITKAATSAEGGAWKNQSFICEDENSLKNAYAKIKAKKILVQEYIRKKNELCIDGISINGGEDVFMPYGCSYYRFTPNSFGYYMYFYPLTDIVLIEKIKKIIKGANFSGIFCVEFLIGPNDELYFLEVNFRNSGWSYANTCGGYNLPFLWALATIESYIDVSDMTPLNEFSAMVEPNDFLVNVVHEKNVSFSQWKKEMKDCLCLFYYNKRDKSPFYHYVWSHIKMTITDRIKAFSIKH